MGNPKQSRLSREEAEELVPELLYGELDDSRAKQVRAQLPACELDGQVAAYERVREAVHSLPDEEPPAMISAQLLHAAAKQIEGKQAGEGAGWWSKLRNGFAPLALHPSVAAAASIAVVGGVVGMLYLVGADQIAQPDVASRETSPTREPGPLTAAPAPAELTKPGVNEPGESAGAPPPPVAAIESKPKDKRAKRRRASQRRGRKRKQDKNGFGAQTRALRKQRSASSRPTGAARDPHADARKLHHQARSAVEKGDCAAANQLSVRIEKMDPRYYRDRVRGDRQLTSCRDSSEK